MKFIQKYRKLSDITSLSLLSKFLNQEKFHSLLKVHFSPFKSHFKMPSLNCTPIVIFSGLRTENSTFTKVSSVDEECGQNFRQQNTKATLFGEKPEDCKTDLYKIIRLLEKSQQLQEKDQGQFTINTKNILRNICNAQNQFILFNQKAQHMIKVHLKDSEKFKSWVSTLKFHTFEEFQKVWSEKKRSIFKKLYKRLCRKFYVENAVPYIMNSRIRNKETKRAHIIYLYRFLQGIQNPETFFYFKQKDKIQMRQEKDLK